ncbi:MAG: tetratricopeptide repeat protein [Fibrobacteria bacterium]|nr:tetratricopeptide repeat protein [Fibrobacteria bacterium]
MNENPYKKKKWLEVFRILICVLCGLFFGPVACGGLYSGHSDNFLRYTLLRMVGSFFYFTVLVLLPLHWAVIASFHLLLSVAMGVSNGRKQRSENWPLYTNNEQSVSFFHNFLAAAYFVCPAVFLFAVGMAMDGLVRHAGKMPASVFGSGFKWVLLLLPVVILLAIFFRHIRFICYPRQLLFFYVGLTFLISVFAIFSHLNIKCLDYFQLSHQPALFFPYYIEQKFNYLTNLLYMSGGLLLLLPLMINARKTRMLAKKMFLTACYCLILFLNLQFISGNLNYYLLGGVKYAFYNYHYSLYQLASRVFLTKLPDYIFAPQLAFESAENLYQRGYVQESKKSFEKIIQKYANKPYHGEMVQKVNTILHAWEKWNRSLQIKSEIDSLKRKDDCSILLAVPVIQKADYLTLDWYGVLSAIASCYPELNDLKLKEKLLTIFSKEERQLPLIDNLPALIPALNRLHAPHTPAFLNIELLIKAVKSNRVPLVFYNYTWVPVVGYDARLAGFWYYNYASNFHKSLSGSDKADDIIFDADGNNEDGKGFKRFAVQKFISASDMEKHLRDIGGIGIIAGDSGLVTKKQSMAAYLIEQGDIYYQQQNDFIMAANCYLRAKELHPNWVVLERIVFLKRRYQHFINDLSVTTSLYIRDTAQFWEKNFNISEEIELQSVHRILQGKAGNFILEQWPRRPRYRSSDILDSLDLIYRFLVKTNPYNTDYLDSLASINYEQGKYAESKEHYKALWSLSPGGNSRALFKIAWLHFKLGEYTKIESILKKRMKPTLTGADAAKLLALKGAVLFSKEKYTAAIQQLRKSLKEDLILPEVHSIIAQAYEKNGEHERALLHRSWQFRTSGRRP